MQRYMASISTEKTTGRRTIQFKAGDRKRRSIRLGKVSIKFARTVSHHVDKLNTARIMRTGVEVETAEWVASLDDVMVEKLARVGLCERRIPVEPEETTEADVITTLGGFLTNEISKRTDVSQSTLTFYSHTQRNLITYFGADKPLPEITEGDADDFRRYLKDLKLAEVTVNRRCSLAKTWFRVAVRHRLIESNPFRDISAGKKSNESRQRFIDADTIARVIEAAPDSEWRLLIALARFGGLRVPSEPLSLRWSDVDWNRQRITVTAPKTHHLPGKETREIPIFPELAEPLREVWELTEDGAEFVITQNRPASLRNNFGNWQGVNLRTRFERIIKRAGLKPWPRLWQNLRSSRETELAESFPLHVVVSWLGNSEAVAARHYLQVTDEHFSKATVKAVQNPVQSDAAASCFVSQADQWHSTQRETRQKETATCENTRPFPLVAKGLEPLTSCL
ncbi:tyrosine-type recombinase/integrase [bacterium]|nr:tyrosine-type recombinase/integrase [bacterium]